MASVIPSIITKFADGIFDENDLIIDLQFDWDYLTSLELSDEVGVGIVTTYLDYTIAAGDIGITMQGSEDVEGEEIVVYRSITDSSLNLTPLSHDDDQNTILINFDTSEDYNLSTRFGTPTVPESRHEDVDDWLDDVFNTCYTDRLSEWAEQLLTAPAPTTYTSKKLFTRRFQIDEMQHSADVKASGDDIDQIKASEETEAY